MRFGLTRRLTVAGGFRYLNLSEQFHGVLIDRSGAFFGDYHIVTNNNLYGGQLGVPTGR